MALQITGGVLLIDSGQLANSADCCCDDCSVPPRGCTVYFENGTRGVAGNQPQVQIDIDSSSITNSEEAEPCTNDCEGCPSVFDSSFVLDPCTTDSYSEEDAIQCNGGGLLAYTPATPMDIFIVVEYQIVTSGTTTTATVTVTCSIKGRGSCADSSTFDDSKFTGIYELTVNNPDTYTLEGASCTDMSETDTYPGEITGSFTTVSETVEHYNPEAYPYTDGASCNDMDLIDVTITIL